MVPQLTTSTLSRADGSATYTIPLYSIIAATTGPIEVSRRDELPSETTIEVSIRPSSGSGTPRERWLESILHSVLRSVLLVHLHPRTLIQVTLQVVKEPGPGKFRKGRGDVAVLPGLVNAAFLACVDAGVPLGTTASAVCVAVGEGGEVWREPTVKQLVGCRSVHAMAFDALGGMVMDESTGKFGVEEWEGVAEVAQRMCAAATAIAGEDEAMANGGVEGEPWLRQALEEKVRDANAWREST